MGTNGTGVPCFGEVWVLMATAMFTVVAGQRADEGSGGKARTEKIRGQETKVPSLTILKKGRIQNRRWRSYMGNM